MTIDDIFGMLLFIGGALGTIVLFVLLYLEWGFNNRPSQRPRRRSFVTVTGDHLRFLLGNKPSRSR
ncbi:hypothetical protein [Nitrospira sp. KM1]|uniref:hypothetical protein n=1 Tax=Nitrospira sp. KM1 TaxID=1936990 RepID=UPI001565EDBF|nr:hypothetical protein [Nitrospira sp. KM1]